MRMDQLPTPCYVIDEEKLKENLSILKEVKEKAGCKILLAQKAFSCQLLLLHEGEPVRSGFQAQETTSKGAGPREPEATQTLFALWRLVS